GELIGPLPRDFVQRWVERGFIVETQWSPVGHQGGTIAMFAPGYDARPRATVHERILQRFTIHTTTKGDKPTAVFLHTYSWPPLGMPGMNIEKIEWTRQAGAKRVFGNEPLERTGSIPYADR
ncbi:MAG: hypothetical protein ACAI38_04765, partial [Myxococcota bacterium]